MILITNCSSLKRTTTTNETTILNNEIQVAEALSKSDKVVLILNQNDYIISFLKENAKNNFSTIRANNDISEEAFDALFNSNTLLNLNQINYSDIDLKDIKISSNTIIKKSNKKPKNISDFLNESSNYEIILSKPLISKNKQFALISFSRGFVGSKEGGFSIYEKDNSDWIKIDNINIWIE